MSMAQDQAADFAGSSPQGSSRRAYLASAAIGVAASVWLFVGDWQKWGVLLLCVVFLVCAFLLAFWATRRGGLASHGVWAGAGAIFALCFVGFSSFPDLQTPDRLPDMAGFVDRTRSWSAEWVNDALQRIFIDVFRAHGAPPRFADVAFLNGAWIIICLLPARFVALAIDRLAGRPEGWGGFIHPLFNSAVMRSAFMLFGFVVLPLLTLLIAFSLGHDSSMKGPLNALLKVAPVFAWGPFVAFSAYMTALALRRPPAAAVVPEAASGKQEVPSPQRDSVRPLYERLTTKSSLMREGWILDHDWKPAAAVRRSAAAQEKAFAPDEVVFYPDRADASFYDLLARGIAQVQDGRSFTLAVCPEGCGESVRQAIEGRNPLLAGLGGIVVWNTHAERNWLLSGAEVLVIEEAPRNGRDLLKDTELKGALERLSLVVVVDAHRQDLARLHHFLHLVGQARPTGARTGFLSNAPHRPGLRRELEKLAHKLSPRTPSKALTVLASAGAEASAARARLLVKSATPLRGAIFEGGEPPSSYRKAMGFWRRLLEIIRSFLRRDAKQGSPMTGEEEPVSGRLAFVGPQRMEADFAMAAEKAGETQEIFFHRQLSEADDAQVLVVQEAGKGAVASLEAGQRGLPGHPDLLTCAVHACDLATEYLLDRYKQADRKLEEKFLPLAQTPALGVSDVADQIMGALRSAPQDEGISEHEIEAAVKLLPGQVAESLGVRASRRGVDRLLNLALGAPSANTSFVETYVGVGQNEFYRLQVRGGVASGEERLRMSEDGGAFFSVTEKDEGLLFAVGTLLWRGEILREVTGWAPGAVPRTLSSQPANEDVRHAPMLSYHFRRRYTLQCGGDHASAPVIEHGLAVDLEHARCELLHLHVGIRRRADKWLAVPANEVLRPGVFRPQNDVRADVRRPYRSVLLLRLRVEEAQALQADAERAAAAALQLALVAAFPSLAPHLVALGLTAGSEERRAPGARTSVDFFFPQGGADDPQRLEAIWTEVFPPDSEEEAPANGVTFAILEDADRDLGAVRSLRAEGGALLISRWLDAARWAQEAEGWKDLGGLDFSAAAAFLARIKGEIP
ncbi:hypothetical protein [Neomegalonema sp.]|uniref:hypothetical protein n=1 Tax=Neomegalonema sp. TaxID=2039713 RepID=UPI00262B6ED7|nr:hypothetical protein [Neomegalonema sp.]MDD2867262.1 hypothetical protein [Neomegalonema sp.]